MNCVKTFKGCFPKYFWSIAKNTFFSAFFWDFSHISVYVNKNSSIKRTSDLVFKIENELSKFVKSFKLIQPMELIFHEIAIRVFRPIFSQISKAFLLISAISVKTHQGKSLSKQVLLGRLEVIDFSLHSVDCSHCRENNCQ